MLNLPGHQTTAAIVAEIQDTREWPEGHYIDSDGKERELSTVWGAAPDVTFHISDCDRKISLEFSFGTPEDMENNLHKIETLYQAISEFRKAYKDEQRAFRRRTKEMGA